MTPKDNQPQSVGVEPHYCPETGCLRQVLPPYIYCDKHQDESSTPPSRPPATIDIDEILEKHSLSVLRAAGIVYKRKLHEKNLLLLDSEAKAQLTDLITEKENRARIEGADDKLKTLAEAAGIMDFCENDLNKILIWVKNHRWSLIAPPGENTQETTPKSKEGL